MTKTKTKPAPVPEPSQPSGWFIPGQALAPRHERHRHEFTFSHRSASPRVDDELVAQFSRLEHPDLAPIAEFRATWRDDPAVRNREAATARLMELREGLAEERRLLAAAQANMLDEHAVERLTEHETNVGWLERSIPHALAAAQAAHEAAVIAVNNATRRASSEAKNALFQTRDRLHAEMLAAVAPILDQLSAYAAARSVADHLTAPHLGDAPK